MSDADEAAESGSGSDSGIDPETQRRVVRERYARIATDAGEVEGSGCSDDGCCTDAGDAERTTDTDVRARQLGYSGSDLDAAGEANLGLGCGNPKALASLEAGETVLDLGAGAGFDCFLAAREVGETGRVLGVDMTPEMVETARDNAAESEFENVEFRLGEIENLPVADGTVDVVVSNCVINLSPDKPRVFHEAFRVLRPGGRLAISDVVLTAEVPAKLRADPGSVASCVAGASTVGALERMLADAGFGDVDVSPKDDSDRFIREWDEERDLSEFLVAASITGRKPTAEPAPGNGLG
ncbi:MAG: arsenite methyltransferase [Haloarculaceae archaeon]